MRGFLKVALMVLVCAASTARAADDASGPDLAKLEQGKHAIRTMQETYAAVVHQEDAAKSEKDAVKLNCVHQNARQISGLITVADRALDDMRVAITTHQPSEAADAELDKIVRAKAKVEALEKDAERCAGLKVVGADNGEGDTVREFTNAAALSEDPLRTLTTADSMPTIASHPPPSSPQ